MHKVLVRVRYRCHKSANGTAITPRSPPAPRSAYMPYGMKVRPSPLTRGRHLRIHLSLHHSSIPCSCLFAHLPECEAPVTRWYELVWFCCPYRVCVCVCSRAPAGGNLRWRNSRRRSWRLAFQQMGSRRTCRRGCWRRTATELEAWMDLGISNRMELNMGRETQGAFYTMFFFAGLFRVSQVWAVDGTPHSPLVELREREGWIWLLFFFTL